MLFISTDVAERWEGGRKESVRAATWKAAACFPVFKHRNTRSVETTKGRSVEGLQDCIEGAPRPFRMHSKRLPCGRYAPATSFDLYHYLIRVSSPSRQGRNSQYIMLMTC